MAKSKVQKEVKFKERKKITRPGIHAKSNTARLKSSKNYRKRYKGQGRQ